MPLVSRARSFGTGSPALEGAREMTRRIQWEIEIFLRTRWWTRTAARKMACKQLSCPGNVAVLGLDTEVCLHVVSSLATLGTRAMIDRSLFLI